MSSHLDSLKSPLPPSAQGAPSPTQMERKCHLPPPPIISTSLHRRTGAAGPGPFVRSSSRSLAAFTIVPCFRVVPFPPPPCVFPEVLATVCSSSLTPRACGIFGNTAHTFRSLWTTYVMMSSFQSLSSKGVQTIKSVIIGNLGSIKFLWPTYLTFAHLGPFILPKNRLFL